MCVILVGFIVFIYMLIVKPAGTLTVTYAKNSAAQVGTTKDCPQCAETVKAAAMKCRFCGFDFPADQVTQEPQQELDQAPTGASGIQAFGHDLGVLWSKKWVRYSVYAMGVVYFIGFFGWAGK